MQTLLAVTGQLWEEGRRRSLHSGSLSFDKRDLGLGLERGIPRYRKLLVSNYVMEFIDHDIIYTLIIRLMRYHCFNYIEGIYVVAL